MTEIVAAREAARRERRSPRRGFFALGALLSMLPQSGCRTRLWDIVDQLDLGLLPLSDLASASPQDLNTPFDSATIPVPACDGSPGLQAGAPWPMWRRCPSGQGRSPYVGPHTAKLKWTFATQGYIESSPAIDVNDVVYFGSFDGNLYALEGATGKLKWSFRDSGGVASSPAIGSDGAIYFGAGGGNLYSLDSANGSLIWSSSLRSATELGSCDTPAIRDVGTIYCNALKHVLAIDTATGRQRWSFPAQTLGLALGADNTVYVASDLGTDNMGSNGNYLWALDGASGTANWTFPLPVGGSLGGATIGIDHSVFVGTREGRVYALDTATGMVHWSSTPPQAAVGAALGVGSDGTLYFGLNGNHPAQTAARAVDGATGKVIWTTYINGSAMYSSPAIGADGTVYMGAGDGNTYAFEGASGKVIWSFPTGAVPISSLPVGSSPSIGADGSLYIGGNDGVFYAFAP